ncbi:haloacid dehalogenase type II [Phycicoccus sp. Root101]|uniref:haloacid dehalogenase type II n=1 Tax=Phycicoccus sp. Root101 TaxID=1736421 RepID=UPI000B1B98B2|nr:haloacid dehalogenase type II [Phycicoccus sp. Root101]
MKPGSADDTTLTMVGERSARPGAHPPASGSSSLRPQVVVFDVNETLSDMSGMADHFAAVGAPSALAGTWFASLLRDGFALTVGGTNPDFADLAATSLTGMLTTQGVDDVGQAVREVMQKFTSLPVHADVIDGVRTLAAAGIRLVTLSNGGTAVAEGLLERNGIADSFERLLSVQDAPTWKPARAAYVYALEVCGVAAGDAMLVAVHPWDIHGGRQAGLRTAYVNREATPYPTFFDRADIEVTSLTDLATRLSLLD